MAAFVERLAAQAIGNATAATAAAEAAQAASGLATSQLSPTTLAFLLVLMLAYIFAIMGVAAYDFLCPNLAQLSVKTGLPEAVVGVTFMAFGNASSDIMSAFIAIKKGSAPLAIGAIIGAAMFVSGVVVGCMGLFGAFAVERRQFLRDAIFLLAATVLLLVSVRDGVITFTESVAMLLLYVIYAVFVVRAGREGRSEEAISPLADVADHLGEYHSNPSTPALSPHGASFLTTPGVAGDGPLSAPDPSSTTHKLMRPSLYSAIEFRHHGASAKIHTDWEDDDNIDPLDPSSQAEAVAAPSTPQLLVSPSADASPATSPGGAALTAPAPAPPAFLAAAARQRDRPTRADERLAALPLLDVERGPPARSLSLPLAGRGGSDGPRSTRSLRTGRGSLWSSTLETGPLISPIYSRHSSLGSVVTARELAQHSLVGHFFPGFIDWRDKPVAAKLNSVIMMPALFVLAATIPIAETNVDVRLLRVHAVLSPLATLLLCFPLTLGSVLGGAAAAAALLAVFMRWHARVPNVVITFWGFVMGVLWVVSLASASVTIMQSLGPLVHISEAVLGLTVVALGNSAGDLVSNLALAKMAHSTMALAASLGSPLLNMMLGIGGSSFTLMLLRHTDRIEIPISRSILISGGFLFVTISAFLVLVPASGWRMTPQIGALAIAMWVGSVALNLVFYEAA